MSKKCAVPFKGTKEQEAKLLEVIAKYKDKEGPLMPVLQEAQGIYGYLPIEVQKMISEGLDISLEHIYGVVTFYAQFSLEPKGKYEIRVCDGTACHVRGSLPVLNAIKEKIKLEDGKFTTKDGLFTLEIVSCLGACGLAPVVVINEKVYPQMTPDAITVILDTLMKEEQ